MSASIPSSSARSSRTAALAATKRFASQLDDSSDDDDDDSSSRLKSTIRRRYSSPSLSQQLVLDNVKPPKQSVARPRKNSVTSLKLTSRKRAESCSSTPTASRRHDEKLADDRGWALVDRDFCVVDPSHDDGLRIWWPCKIHKRQGQTLRISLCGELPSGQNYINTVPSSSVRSYEGKPQQPRFTVFDEAMTTASHDLNGSPSKRMRFSLGGLEQRWHRAAMSLACTTSCDSDEDLPDVSVAFSTSYKPPPAQIKPITLSFAPSIPSDDELSTMTDYGEYDWVPELPDPLLDIPGELVLAKSKADDKVYWPAKIIDFVPSTDRRRPKGRYLVVYLDTTKGRIPRHFFFTTEEDAFATCHIGDFQSSARDILPDDDEEENSGENRDPSPGIIIETPSKEQFCDLGIREQFAYTKPILVAILNGTYSPAKFRHDAYLKGGKSRKSIVEIAGSRGGMDHAEWSELEQCLRHWCLRASQKANLIFDEDVVIPDTANTHCLESESPFPPSQTSTMPEIAPSSSPLSAIASESDPTMCLNSSRTSLPDCDIGLKDEKFPTSRAASPTAEYHPMISVTNAMDEHSFGNTASEKEIPSVRSNTHPQSTSHASLHAQNGYSDASTPRQIGCEAFEGLPPSEKLDYCLNVLLPEAVLQILIWRSGKRTSHKLLDDQIERELHDQGMKLADQRDWVFDVMRLRGLKERRYRKLTRTTNNDTRC